MKVPEALDGSIWEEQLHDHPLELEMERAVDRPEPKSQPANRRRWL